MMRWDVINKLIVDNNYKRYLEIGVQDANCNFAKIKIDYKISVDPFPRNYCDFIGTSDEYFSQLDDKIKFDIIFIDGLHHSNQVLVDINNSLKHLTGNGVVVVHDCLPTSEKMQEYENHGAEWTGDVWKAIAELRITRSDIAIKVIDTDYGCGIIKKEKTERYIPKSISYATYEYYASNKKNMLNVISINEFNES